MIIKRIREIKNIGQFFKTGMNSPIDRDFTKVSLIYGLNGFGKSTLSDIFYSLKQGNPSILEAKKTIPARGDMSCNFSLANDFQGAETAVEFKSGAWTSKAENFEVFDSRFISENVYSDFAITHEHKKRISALILGEAGVLLAREIEDIQRSAEETKRESKTADEKIRALLPRSYRGTVESFVDIDEKNRTRIADKPNLESKLKSVIEAEKVKALAEPEAINYDCELISKVLFSIEADLALTEASITAEVTEKVEDHIAKHLDKDGEKWLSKGLAYYSRDGLCPFCSQSTSPVKEFIAAYTDFFSTEYESFVDRVSNNLDTHSESIRVGQGQIERIVATFDRNNDRLTKAKDYLNKAEYEKLASDLGGIEEKIRISCEAILKSFKIIQPDIGLKVVSKKRKPLKLYALEAFDRTDLLKNEVALNTAIGEYDSLIAEAKSSIQNLKHVTGTEKQADVENQIAEVEVIEVRFSEKAIEYVAGLITKKQLVVKLESDKAAKEADLANHNKLVAQKYLKEANEVLKDCGCRFTIRAPEDFSRRGHMPVIDLAFTLMGTDVDGRSFGDILCESDKRCLAFALFIAKLHADPQIAEKVVILDDPFTSLDDNRQDHTILQVKKIANKAAQVIVMCHYSQPMSELANDFKGSLQLSIENNPTDGSKFVIRDLFKLQNNKHHCRLDELQSVLENDIDQSRFPAIRGTVRNVIEHELLSRFRPTFVGSTSNTLGDIITELEHAIRDGKVSLKGDTTDTITTLRHINSRTSGEHHAEVASGDNTDNIENLRNLIRTAFTVIYEKL